MPNARLWTARASLVDHDMGWRPIELAAGGQDVYLLGLDRVAGEHVTRLMQFDGETGSAAWEIATVSSGWGCCWVPHVTADDTHVYVARSVETAGTDNLLRVNAYEVASGSPAWERTYEVPGSGSAFARDIVASGGRVYVTGGSGADALTIAFDSATGAPAWTSRYRAVGDRGRDGVSISLSPDGTRVYVANDISTKTLSSGYSDIGVVALAAADGAIVWTSVYDSGAPESPIALAVTPDGGRLIATGTVMRTSQFDLDFTTVAFDSNDGSRLWGATFGGSGHDLDVPHGIVTSPDSERVFVTGSVDHIARQTFAYDSTTGAELWSSRHPGEPADGLVIDPDGGRLYMTGEALLSPPQIGGAATSAIDPADGTSAWWALPDPRSLGGRETPQAIALSPDGRRVFVAGQFHGDGGVALQVAAYCAEPPGRPLTCEPV